MNLDEQKNLVLGKLKKDKVIPIDLRKKIENQIFLMSDEEFSIFLENISEVESENESKAKILKMQAMEKNNHTEYMQMVNEFSRNITRQESENQKNIDKSKADSLLNQIKSL